MTTTTEPTQSEKIRALEETAVRLVAERDQALADAKRAHGRVRIAVHINRCLRDELDARNREVRLLTDENYRIATERSDLEQQLDKAQQQLATVPRRKRWRFFYRLNRT